MEGAVDDMGQPLDPTLQCFECKKVGAAASDLQRCSRCKSISYCNAACQRANWLKHKPVCRADGTWFDKYRGPLMDKSYHQGDAELITWEWTAPGLGRIGWGNTLAAEAADLRAKFEGEFGGSAERLYLYWSQAFRWTCCGADGSVEYGCDHHGTGPRPCTCDFCKMGKPLPDHIYHDKDNAGSRMGLTLPRGPDPRSYSALQGSIAQMGRAMTGMDEEDSDE